MYDAVIVGGGIAGASAAIHLARCGRHVRLLERKTGPVHKICGEFLSGEAAGLLSRLGVLGDVRAAGAMPISNSSFTSVSGQAFERKLPSDAFGISRYELDNILLRRSAACGATVTTGTAVLGISGSIDNGFTVSTADEQIHTRLVIGAYGKKAPLDSFLGRQWSKGGSTLSGYKSHYRGVCRLDAVEIYLFPGGYCGIAPVENGGVNVCWLIRQRSDSHSLSLDVQLAALRQNAALGRRLDHLTIESGTTQAIGGATLAHKGPFSAEICMIGDTVQMIAPFCGDGMSMAFRSAELAAPLCDDYLAGRLNRNSLIALYTREWKKEFSTRLLIGRALQYAAFHGTLSELMLNLVSKHPALSDWLIRSTRGRDYAAGPSAPTRPNRHPSIVNPGPKARATPER